MKWAIYKRDPDFSWLLLPKPIAYVEADTKEEAEGKANLSGIYAYKLSDNNSLKATDDNKSDT